MANTRAGTKFHRFLPNSSGNVTIMVALAAIPLVAGAGLAIDYLRGVRTQSELQQVADAAALAGAAAKNVTGTTAQKKAQREAIATNYITASVAKVSDVVMVGSPVVTSSTDFVDIQLNAKVAGSLINVLNIGSSG
ncbi:MAG TPA: pilus assembly protein TadG-related protein, partial [Aestuariivirga sp.]|nr:pilus assembly protein TadG-related protein [Aestuariivirga sp.]